MRRFSLLALVLFFAACGGDPSEHRDTCHPDPSEARVEVSVSLRNEAANLDDRLNNVTSLSHDNVWNVFLESELGHSAHISPPELGLEMRHAVSLDTIRGDQAVLSTVRGPFSLDAPPPAFHTVTLDRSCELVIVVSDEWDGETITFHLSHFWR